MTSQGRTAQAHGQVLLTPRPVSAHVRPAARPLSAGQSPAARERSPLTASLGAQPRPTGRGSPPGHCPREDRQPCAFEPL